MTGLRVELQITDPIACPVAETTNQLGGTAGDVSRSGDREQFTIDQNANPQGDLDEVFTYDNESILEFDRLARTCTCELIEETGQPVADVRAEEGSLYVTIYPNDRESLTATMAHLQSELEGVRLQTISRTGSDDSNGGDLVPVDRQQLTERQREVIETANEMGYFEHPREANAGEVADELGICTSTMVEHLLTAQSKIYTDLFGAPDESAES